MIERFHALHVPRSPSFVPFPDRQLGLESTKTNPNCGGHRRHGVQLREPSQHELTQFDGVAT